MRPMRTEVVIVGAGIVGAMCAYYINRSGLKAIVLDRGTVASGTTGAGEGNIMVSDKSPGPELELALKSREMWFEVADDIGNEFELVAKGGLAVSRGDATSLFKLSEQQSGAGVLTKKVGPKEIQELEPYISKDIINGVHYPQDAQCQPMLAAAHILRQLQRSGLNFIGHQKVVGIERIAQNLIVRTSDLEIQCGYVINAAGTWAGEIARIAGSDLPIMPRRGFILVTAPLPKYVNHKVYDSDYVDNVASSDAELQTSTVIEGTQSGTILIGATRERIGFDRTISVPVIQRLARQATSLFPVLANAQLLRVYNGFRPYSPDHLPVIGADAKIPGLFHCAGHEGAGIGLSAASGKLIAQLIKGETPIVDPAPFSPGRFQLVHQ